MCVATNKIREKEKVRTINTAHNRTNENSSKIINNTRSLFWYKNNKIVARK